MSFTISVKNSVAFIYINTLNSKVNYVDQTTLDNVPDLVEQLNKLAIDVHINYLIISSTKLNSFMTSVGLSILQGNCASSIAMSSISNTLQLLANTIESFPKPVIAVINGECSSFGLELALACKYRIAINSLNCNFGFPDVEWGLCPAAGGCRRLASTMTLETTLDLLLSGRCINAEEAYHVGLVHKLSDESQLEIQGVEHLSVEFVQSENQAQLNFKRRRLINSYLSVDNVTDFISFKSNVLHRKRAELLHTCKFIYAAPAAILGLVEHALKYKKGSETIVAYDLIERICFAGLAANKKTQPLLNLQRAKFQQMLNYNKSDSTDYCIVILGDDRGTFAAFLRNDLNSKSSISCFPTFGSSMLNCDNKHRLIQLMRYNEDLLAKSLPVNRTFIIENSSEDLLIKAKWKHNFNLVDGLYLKVYTSLASSISDEDNDNNIVKVRMHNYIKKFKVLEVLGSENLSSQLLDNLITFGYNLGNLVITVNGTSGYVFRLLMAMASEVLNLIVEGENPWKIQKWLFKFGYESKVLILFDKIGLDVIHRELSYYFAKIYLQKLQCDKVLVFLEKMIARGFLGIKSGIGFHLNEKMKNKQVLQILKECNWKPSTKAINRENVQWRVTCKLVNEAVTCLQENVIDSILTADAAAVYAIGFPPASGGPFQWLDTNGAPNIIEKIIEFGEVPSKLLCENANVNKTFY